MPPPLPDDDAEAAHPFGSEMVPLGVFHGQAQQAVEVRAEARETLAGFDREHGSSHQVLQLVHSRVHRAEAHGEEAQEDQCADDHHGQRVGAEDREEADNTDAGEPPLAQLAAQDLHLLGRPGD